MDDRFSSRNGSNGNDENISKDYDEYSRMYEEQLDEFSRMDGQNFGDELDISDLEFHDEDYIAAQSRTDRYNPYTRRSSNSDGGRTPTYSQRTSAHNNSMPRSSNQQRRRPPNYAQKSRPATRNDDLQFGKNRTSARAGQRGYGYRDNAKPGTNKRSKSKKMNDKKKSPVKRFFKWLIIILLVLLILAELLIYRYVSMVKVVETGERLYTNASMHDDSIMNVLIIGSDSRSIDERGRTDSMILLSIDKKTDKITMTSFMRDMYVEIPNNGWNKLNAANVYGGPELLMDTIELNFDIRVDKYIYIDFYSFVDIVDAVGGIEIDVSDEEAAGMKAPMAEQNNIMDKPEGTDYLSSGGKLNLNGNQALAYARLRYVGNADFERTERQRTVLNKIKEKAVTFNPFKLDKIAKASLSHLTTNMSKTEMQLLANRLPFIIKYDTAELRLPEENMYTYGSHDGQSTLDVDFEACKELLRKNIYG